VHWNLTTPGGQLYEEAVDARRRSCRQEMDRCRDSGSAYGPFASDKFVVKGCEPRIPDRWDNNKAMSTAHLRCGLFKRNDVISHRAASFSQRHFRRATTHAFASRCASSRIRWHSSSCSRFDYVRAPHDLKQIRFPNSRSSITALSPIRHPRLGEPNRRSMVNFTKKIILIGGPYYAAK